MTQYMLMKEGPHKEPRGQIGRENGTAMKLSKTIKAPIITLRYPSQSDMYPWNGNSTKEPIEVEKPRTVCQFCAMLDGLCRLP